MGSPALTFYGFVLWRCPWITSEPEGELNAFLMHNGLERSNWWELKSQVSSTAFCPCCLSGGQRSCFTGVLNIDLSPKPPSGFLKSHFSETRTRWEEDKEQWTISIQAEDFLSPTGLFKVPLLLSAGLCCCWVENCRSTSLAKLHSVWSFHLSGSRRQVFKLLQHFSRLDHELKSRRTTDPGKRK